MLEKRYLYVLICGMANVFASTFPTNLIFSSRYNGAYTSMVLGSVIGVIFIFATIKSLSFFPGKNLVNILSDFGFTRFISVPIILLLVLMWLIEGFFLQYITMTIFKLYFLPNYTSIMIWIPIFLLILIMSKMDSKSLMFLFEILFITFVVGEIVIIMVLYVLNYKTISVNDIFLSLTYAAKPPTYQAISISTWVFSGFSTLAVFNQVIIDEKKPIKLVFLCGLAGFYLLLQRYIPIIAHLGLAGSGKFAFPGYSTLDALRFHAFITERSIYIFLFLLTAGFLVASILLWHVSIVILREAIHLKNKFEWGFFLLIGLIIYFCDVYLTQDTYFTLMRIFSEGRLFIEILFTFLLIYCARKKVKQNEV